MRFWDASAIVPLLVSERESRAVTSLLDVDPDMLVWWGTPVECVSAIARREREGALSRGDASRAIDRLARVAESWQEVLPTDPVRSTAQRLLRVHPLRAADALQLAAAVIAAEHDPRSLEVVSLDDRLNDAASREGFRVVTGEGSSGT